MGTSQFEVIVQDGKMVYVFLDRFSSKSRKRVWACSVCIINMEGRNTSGCLSSKILAAKRKSYFEDVLIEEFVQGGWHIFFNPST